MKEYKLMLGEWNPNKTCIYEIGEAIFPVSWLRVES